jgi:hypothetical protein
MAIYGRFFQMIPSELIKGAFIGLNLENCHPTFYPVFLSLHFQVFLEAESVVVAELSPEVSSVAAEPQVASAAAEPQVASVAA